MYVDPKIKTKKYKETTAFLTYLQIFKNHNYKPNVIKV